ncbi:MAG: hypothetical protein JSS02_17105 [Planctomycetes bacterium]|nr:hypothetical protein [Planctomycetota bacterium]
MTILLVIPVAFVAFCVWLTVRIINRRERWAKWAAAVLGIPMSYALSFGCISWLWWRGFIPRSADPVLNRFFSPFIWAMTSGPKWLADAVFWYAELWH